MPAFPPPPSWAAELETVGVTGTNGKTTTVQWIAAALATVDDRTAAVTTIEARVGRQRLAMEPTYGSFLAVMRRCREQGGRHAVIELTSAALGAGFWRGWPCRVGVFTNLSRDHLDLHRQAEHYLASKAQLFLHLPAGGSAVLNAADECSELLAEVIPAGVEVWRYAAAPGAGLDLWAQHIETSWQGTRVALSGSARLGSLPPRLELSAIGACYAENALAAILGAVAAGVPAAQAAAAIARTPPPPGRFEVIRREPFFVVVDYAHTPDALARTVRTARELCRGELWVLTGAGGDRERGKRRLLGAAAAAADRVIVTSDNPRSEDPAQIAAEVAAGLADHERVEVILDRRRAIERAVAAAGPGDVVLVAGKGHEAVQIVRGQAHPLSDADVIRRCSAGSEPERRG